MNRPTSIAGASRRRRAKDVAPATWLVRLTTSPLHYWCSFVSDSMVVVLFLAFGGRGARPFEIIAALGVGTAIYTLSEYGFHRWLYHATRVHSLHALHHADPRAPVGAPFFFTLALAASAFWLACRVVAAPVAAVFAGAFLGTHVYQGVVHHALHQGWGGAFRVLRRHHHLHHRRGDTNFGVSTIFWDRIFRTHSRD